MDVPEESEVAALQASSWQELYEVFTPATSVMPSSNNGLTIQLLVIVLAPPDKNNHVQLFLLYFVLYDEGR